MRCKWLILTICLYSSLIAQITNFSRTGDIFGTRAFVENRGQFDSINLEGAPVLYALENAYEKVYFTKKGLIYVLTPEEFLSEAEIKDKYCRKEWRERTSQTFTVVMKWLGNDPERVSIVPQEKQEHYITYGGPEFNASVYKKITFSNVYAGIDVEYVIPAEKPHGIKYNFIIKPNADPGKIAFLYSGDVNSVKKDNFGQIEVTTNAASIVEHVPVSYSAGKIVPSQFVLNSDTIRFQFPKGYDKQSELVIDPWVTSITSFTANNNFAYDVDYDVLGNIFIYGTYNPMRVAKYSNNGTLQWCFSGTILNPSWSSQPANWVGNFVVERSMGKCFIGQGVSSIGSKVVRLDNNGNYDNFISIPNSNFQEIWDMGFHCSDNTVFALGGGHVGNTSAATISNMTGTLNFSTFQPSINTSQQDIASGCIDDQGEVFVVYSTNTTPQLNNRICRVNGTFNGNVWTTPTSFGAFNEAGNKSYGGQTLLSNGFNCLGVNQAYLFYYDGRNLAAYSKSTGQLLSSATISSLTIKNQGGIVADDCNIVYVGGRGYILTFQFNGTSFIPLTPIAIVTGSTSPACVYDLKFNKANNSIYASGQGFCGIYAAALSSSCQPAYASCINNFAISINCTTLTCSNPGSATVTMLGPGTYTCLWLPSGATGSVATGLSAGTYTLHINISGTVKGFSTAVTFSPAMLLKGNVSHTGLLPCASMTSGTASIINLEGHTPGKMTYLWTGANLSVTSSSVAGLSPGHYSVTVVNLETGCSFSKTFNIASPPSLSLTIVASSPTACAGSSISFTGTCAGGVPGYSFQWINGPPIATHQVSQQQGVYNYSLSVLDSYKCKVNAQTTVTFVPNPVITVQTVTICPLESGTLKAAGATSYTWNIGTTGAFLVDSPAGTSGYTVTGSVNGCESKASGSIIVLSVPLGTLVSNNPVCENSVLNLIIKGGAYYNWIGPGSFSSSDSNIVLNSIIPSQSGIYSVTLTAVTGCTNSASVDITVFPKINLAATGDAVCQFQKAKVKVSGADKYKWTGENGFSSTLADNSLPPRQVVGISIYTVIGTSVNNSSAVAYASVETYSLPEPILKSPLFQKVCMDDSVKFLAEGAIKYEWQGPNTILFTGPRAGFAAVAADYSGTYTLVVHNDKNCVSTLTTNVLVLPLPEGRLVPDSMRRCVPFCTKYSFKSNSPFNDVTNVWWQMDSILVERNEVTRCFSAPGDYNLKAVVRNINGCNSSQTLNVVVPAMPLADFAYSPATPLAQLDDVHFFNSSTAEGPTKYSWHINLNNEQELLFKNPKTGVQTVFAEPGNYVVVLVAEDKWGCRDTAIKVVHVKEDACVFVPNAFTPNGDGLNETFKPVLRGYSLTSLLVFDRWGEQIFQSSSVDKGWDGKYVNEECETDVYTWKLNLLSPDGKEEQLSGMVHLLK